jgi:hypothetical protein
MLSHGIFQALGVANFEVLTEDKPGSGIVTKARFVRDDWTQKAIPHPERLQRLVQRGDIFPVRPTVSVTIHRDKTISGYVFNDTPRGEWAYRAALGRVARAYDFSEAE